MSPEDLIATVRELPVRRGKEHWEVGLLELDLPGQSGPAQKSKGPGGAVLAPLRVAVCVSGKDAASTVTADVDGGPPSDRFFALRAVASCALEPMVLGAKPPRYLPATVRVATVPPSMLDQLREVLEPMGVAVEVKSSLERVSALKEMLLLGEELMMDGGLEMLPRALMTGEGVSLDRVRAFADAAAVFAKAAPWDIAPTQVWEVRSPKPPAELCCFTIMGMAGQEFGLGFVSSPEQFDAIATGDLDLVWEKTPGRMWSLTFDPLDNAMIPEDVLLWRSQRLPKAKVPGLGNVAWLPVPIGAASDGSVERPDARTLAFMEGLLRATALMADEHVNAGELRATVDTADGPVEAIAVCVRDQ